LIEKFGERLWISCTPLMEKWSVKSAAFNSESHYTSLLHFSLNQKTPRPGLEPKTWRIFIQDLWITDVQF
jgi:hypothetical protein